MLSKNMKKNSEINKKITFFAVNPIINRELQRMMDFVDVLRETSAVAQSRDLYKRNEVIPTFNRLQ